MGLGLRVWSRRILIRFFKTTKLTVFFFFLHRKNSIQDIYITEKYIPGSMLMICIKQQPRKAYFCRYNTIFPVPNISKSLYDLSDKRTMISVFSYQCFQKLHVVAIFPFVNIQLWAKRWSSQKLEILNTMFIVIWLIKTNHFRGRLDHPRFPRPLNLPHCRSFTL